MEPEAYTTLRAVEETYWWYRGLHRLALDRVAEILPPPGSGPGGRILDAGCGTGGMLIELGGWGGCFGIDYSPLALGPARGRGVLTLTRGSVTRLPYRSGSFSLIVSLDVLYHRGVESDLAALREFHRCLRPGGAVVLNLPALESLRSTHDAAVHTARRYRRGPLRALLAEAGLEPVRVTYWNTLLFPGLALVRLLRRRHLNPDASSRPPSSDVVPLPKAMNAALAGVLALERLWLRARDLPFGLSLLAVARRPGTPP